MKECIKKGMIPLSDEMFVEEFDFNGILYQTLGVHDIYSGWEITVVAMIDMNFSFLINLIKTTKIYDELVGGIGMLLKMYPEKFTNYLEKCSISDKRIKRIKKIIMKMK